MGPKKDTFILFILRNTFNRFTLSQNLSISSNLPGSSVKNREQPTDRTNWQMMRYLEKAIRLRCTFAAKNHIKKKNYKTIETLSHI